MPPPPSPDLVARLRGAGCVFAEDEADELLLAADGDPARLEALTARRVAGEPLEYVVGSVAFDGDRLVVVPGVFIPRQRSLLLVELASVAAPEDGHLVDLGCGSGALAYAVARRRPGLRVHAVDIDPAAADCARTNLSRLPGGTATVSVGDLYAPLPSMLHGSVDVLIAHLPYVPSHARATMPADSRDHEPATSTDGGEDGLDLIRRALGGAPRWLRPGGRILMETGDASTGQEQAAMALCTEAGLTATIHSDEERGATVVVGALEDLVR